MFIEFMFLLQLETKMTTTTEARDLKVFFLYVELLFFPTNIVGCIFLQVSNILVMCYANMHCIVLAIFNILGGQNGTNTQNCFFCLILISFLPLDFLLYFLHVIFHNDLEKKLLRLDYITNKMYFSNRFDQQICDTIVHIVVQAPKLTWRLLKGYLHRKSCWPCKIQNGGHFFKMAAIPDNHSCFYYITCCV